MNKRSRQGPFRPGPGGLPPYLAGRESEQALCRDILYDLRNGLAPPREIVFHGPRGNGKTALLVWLQQEAALFPGIDVVRLTPSEIPSISKFVEQLLPASWIRKFAPGEITLHGIIWRPGQGDPPPLHEALAARAKEAANIAARRSAYAGGRNWLRIVERGSAGGKRVPLLAGAGGHAEPAFSLECDECVLLESRCAAAYPLGKFH